MSLPNLKDKIEGKLPEGLGEPGRSGGVREILAEAPTETLEETVEETVEEVETVPERKLKGRKIKKRKTKK